MLNITIPAMDHEWDEVTEHFITIPETHLVLEHSLISISKWESKYHKPFLSDIEKTTEEMLYYIECMTMTQNIDPKYFYYIPVEEIDRINEYINDDHTATHFTEEITPDKPGSTKNKDILTSEMIYYYMVALQIPFECQKWHLGRLLALIKLTNKKNEEADPNYKKKRKLTAKQQNDLAKRYDEINRQRRAALNSKG